MNNAQLFYAVTYFKSGKVQPDKLTTPEYAGLLILGDDEFLEGELSSNLITKKSVERIQNYVGVVRKSVVTV